MFAILLIKSDLRVAIFLHSFQASSQTFFQRLFTLRITSSATEHNDGFFINRHFSPSQYFIQRSTTSQANIKFIKTAVAHAGREYIAERFLSQACHFGLGGLDSAFKLLGKRGEESSCSKTCQPNSVFSGSVVAPRVLYST